jgi:hypothetical protein
MLENTSRYYAVMRLRLIAIKLTRYAKYTCNQRKGKTAYFKLVEKTGYNGIPWSPDRWGACTWLISEKLVVGCLAEH